MGSTKSTRKLAPFTKVRLKPDQIADRATSEYERLCSEFERRRSAVDFDFREHCTEWTARGDHLTHRIHRYPGRLTPYIPLFFLSVRGVAVNEGNLLDPFAGCGTVLVEAPVHPVHPMRPMGLEINPLARLIAKVKTTPLEARAVLDAWERIKRRYELDQSRAGLARFPNKRHWFSQPVELRLARAIRALDGLRDPDMRDFFLVATSSVVRQVSLADPSVAVPVILDPSRFKGNVKKRVQSKLDSRMNADVISVLDKTVRENLNRLTAWTESRTLAVEKAIKGADARTFKTAAYRERGELARYSGSVSGVDLILTSPPYANAQRYTRSLRLEMFALGFTKDGADERSLDRLQVGTERVAELEWPEMNEPTGISAADAVIKSVKKTDKYRAAIVGKYVRDMSQVVQNCFNALNEGGHAVFVLGNNNVRGQLLDNAKILDEIGANAGFESVLHVKNKIPSRGLLTKRHPTAGVITHEHVLVLRKPPTTRTRRCSA